MPPATIAPLGKGERQWSDYFKIFFYFSLLQVNYIFNILLKFKKFCDRIEPAEESAQNKARFHLRCSAPAVMPSLLYSHRLFSRVYERRDAYEK